MKKITLILGCLIGSIGLMNAQNARTISDLPNTTNNPEHYQGDPVTTTATVNYEKPTNAQGFSDFVSTPTHTVTKTHNNTIISYNRGATGVTPYSDRSVFQAAYSGTLISEDFSGGPGAGAIQPCGPVISSAGDGCFAAGVLEDGFSVTVKTSGNETIYIGAGAVGNTSTLVGANTFNDTTVLNFAPNGAYAAGMDLFVSGVTNADLRVYDTGGNLLDSFTLTNTPDTENFVGVISDVAIGKIEMQGAADSGELFGNLDFGTDPIGGGGACEEENPNDFTFENGTNCSSAASFKTANDLTVAVNESFTLTNITASIFANGGIMNVDVFYYDDAAGLPGTQIGAEASVTIDSQTVIGNNFGYDVNEVELSVSPFVFVGQPAVTTTYWIQLSVTDGSASGNVFWLITSSSMVGNPTALFDAGWTIYDPAFDGVYIWEGQCDPLSVADNEIAGFNYYPNPTNDVMHISATKNIESVAVYNLLGQKVITSTIGATSSDLNLSGLTAGAYIMKVTVEGKTGTYKILKN